MQPPSSRGVCRAVPCRAPTCTPARPCCAARSCPYSAHTCRVPTCRPAHTAPQIMESLGGDQLWIDRFLAQVRRARQHACVRAQRTHATRAPADMHLPAPADMHPHWHTHATARRDCLLLDPAGPVCGVAVAGVQLQRAHRGARRRHIRCARPRVCVCLFGCRLVAVCTCPHATAASQLSTFRCSQAAVPGTKRCTDARTRWCLLQGSLLMRMRSC
jgi:hypothetical protein